MDLPKMMRRMQSFNDGAPGSNNQRVSFSPGLTVDTSVEKTSFRKLDSLDQAMEPQWGAGDETPTPQPTPTSTRSEDSDRYVRRRRSNSECLLMMKNGQDLPGPCKEYISSVKQILARSEEKEPLRRRSMSLRNSPVLNG